MEIGCMAPFSDDVEALLPETEEVDQQAKAACEADDEGALAPAAATTSTEEDKAATTLQQEQRDDGNKAPEHVAEAPAATPAPGEHGGDEKDQQVVKKEEEVVEHKAAAVAVAVDQEMSTRERLKRHRREMAGRVWVPEMWGQEKLLKDWVDCAVFDRPMVPTGLLTARRALIAECRSARHRPDRTTSSPSASTTSSSNPLPVRNGCS